MLQECRFYENEMPEAGTLVMVEVVGLSDTSATVRLLEYANKEGMVPFNELTRHRIRSIGKVIKVGKIEAVEVLRVDAEKGYIDLGKKKLTVADARSCVDRYHQAKVVQRVMRWAAEKHGIPFKDLLEKVSWPMYRDFGHAQQGFKAIVEDASVLNKYTASLPKEVHETLLSMIRQALAAKKVQVRLEIKMSCYTCEGVDAIRDVLFLGRRIGDVPPVMPVSVQVTAPPNYRLFLVTDEREAGMQKLTDCFKAMKEEMTKRGGEVSIVSGPFIVGEDRSDDEGDGKAAADSEKE